MMDHERLNPILDWIGIPINGIDKLVNTDSRSDKMSNQHRVVKNILTWLPNNNNLIKIITYPCGFPIKHLYAK